MTRAASYLLILLDLLLCELILIACPTCRRIKL